MQKLANEKGAIVERRVDMCCSGFGATLRANPPKEAAEMLPVPATNMASERNVAVAALLISMLAPFYCNLSYFYLDV